MSLISDVLEHIFSFVDIPRDLLSLALSCRTFHTLIIPYHLELRYIRCDPLLLSLWNELEHKPAYAQRVRRVELVPGNSYGRPARRIPSFLVSQDNIDELNRLEDLALHVGPSVLVALGAALRNMINLQRLCWADMRIEDPGSFSQLVSQLQEGCPSLKEIEFDSDNKEPIIDFNLVGSSFWKFSKLTSLSLAIPPPSDPSLLDQMMSMLLYQCPSLKELGLVFLNSIFRLAPILHHGHWPTLRRLTLIGNMHLEATETFDQMGNVTTAEFLTRHPMLECLFFLPWNVDGPKCTIYPGTLPSLRSLSVFHRDHNPVSIPFDVACHVRYFGLFMYDDVKRDIILDTLTSMSALRFLVITRWSRDYLKDLVHAIPQIERLKFLRPLVSSWGGFEDYERSQLEPLHSLTRLTHLAGLVWVKTATNPPESLLRNVATNPSLKYVAITPMTHTRKDVWISLQRNDAGEYTRWVTAEDSSDLNWKNWGDIFHGLIPTVF